MKRNVRMTTRLLMPVILMTIIGIACKKNSQADRYAELRKNIPEAYKAFVNPFNDGSTIGAAVNLSYGIIILYNKAGTKYAWYQDQRIQGVFSIKDANSPLGATLLDSVGAAMEHIVSGLDGCVLLFDQTGTRVVSMCYDIGILDASGTQMPADILAEHSTSIKNANSFKGPFESTGFEAAAKYVKPFVQKDAWHIFDKGGTQYARWVEETGLWGSVTQFTAWGGNNNLFPAVGAATFFEINDFPHNIFISKDGSQMGTWHLEGGISVFEGPWTIN